MGWKGRKFYWVTCVRDADVILRVDKFKNTLNLVSKVSRLRIAFKLRDGRDHDVRFPR